MTHDDNAKLRELLLFLGSEQMRSVSANEDYRHGFNCAVANAHEEVQRLLASPAPVAEAASDGEIEAAIRSFGEALVAYAEIHAAPGCNDEEHSATNDKCNAAMANAKRLIASRIASAAATNEAVVKAAVRRIAVKAFRAWDDSDNPSPEWARDFATTLEWAIQHDEQS